MCGTGTPYLDYVCRTSNIYVRCEALLLWYRIHAVRFVASVDKLSRGSAYAVAQGGGPCATPPLLLGVCGTLSGEYAVYILFSFRFTQLGVFASTYIVGWWAAGIKLRVLMFCCHFRHQTSCVDALLAPFVRWWAAGIKLRVLMFCCHFRHQTSCVDVLMAPFVRL